MKLRRPLLMGILLTAPVAARGQGGTDIYLLPLTRSGAGLTLGKPVNLTLRPGYDNQPSFSPEGRNIYFTSQRGGQTDIYRYDIGAATTTAVTATPESEYSPTVMPDRKHFSVIRVEPDSTQRLWQFTLAGAAVGPILDSIKPVGYHAWLNADTVFVFVLGAPATLRRAELPHGTARIVASNIGRALFLVPGSRQMSFIQQDSVGGWVRAIDPLTGAGESLVRLPEGAGFFAWTPSGEILTAVGNRVLLWKRGATGWAELAAFTEPGLQQITRLAVSPAGDRLALVGGEPEPRKTP